jgi:hypothetical protein
MVEHPLVDEAEAEIASSSTAVTRDGITAAGILSSPIEPSTSLAAELASVALIRDRYKPFQECRYVA